MHPSSLKYARTLTLVAVNVAVTILLIEVALRVVPIPGFSTYMEAIRMLHGQRDSYRSDPEGGMRVFLPNRTFTWTIMDGDFDITTIPFPDSDSLGLRDDGLNPTARRKVFATGDSFTFGFGVDDEDVWHEVLERSYGGEVDIFSLRGIGAALPEIEARYPRYRDRFDHDTVFLAIYLGNEFAEAAAMATSPPSSAEVVAGQAGDVAIDGPGTDLSGAVYSFLRHHSYTARLVKFLFFKRLIRIGYYNYDVEREVYQPEGSPFVFTIDYEEDILVRTCEKDYSPRMQAGVERFEESLEALVRTIEEDGRQVYAFVFPFKEQVYWDQWAHRLKDPDAYDPLKPNRVVSAALERAKIPYYDLTLDMIEAARTEILYWPIDSHWNPAGNHLAADLARAWLMEQGFPGPAVDEAGPSSRR